MSRDTASDGPGHRPATDADDAMILRDYLALERTCLANERTLLAYTRTALMLFISGVTLIKLFAHIPALVVTGYLLLPAALLVAVVGTHRFAQVRRRMDAGG